MATIQKGTGMSHPLLVQTAADYLRALCVNIPSRPVGSSGNRRAADWFAQTIAGFGFTTEMPQFDCMGWSSGGVSLTIGGESFRAQTSPYSLGCKLCAPLVAVSTTTELEETPFADKILLLHGEIAREPLMPKKFPFYNPEEHQHIYRLLEGQPPAAIITATRGDAMFEDGDFDIPSVYVPAAEGERLAGCAGQTVHLVSRAERHPAAACNVLAHKPGSSGQRIVVMAHIDAKVGTPGALDNGAGIVTLLLLAEMLSTYNGHHTIEIVAVNGEDYYANSGEIDYLHRNLDAFDEIELCINLDGLGYIEGRTAYSLYACPPDLAAVIHTGLSSFAGLFEGEHWYQGDHMILVMQQRPALAFTSERAIELTSGILHTAQDTPALVDPHRLVEAAHAVREVIGWVDCLGISSLVNGNHHANTNSHPCR
jgi:aminopeptidase YwaD